MTEDEARQLDAIYERNNLELFALIRKYDDEAKAKNLQGKELLEWKLQQYEKMGDLIEWHHHRDLLWRIYPERVEPQVHFAEAVLVGKAGLDG